MRQFLLILPILYQCLNLPPLYTVSSFFIRSFPHVLDTIRPTLCRPADILTDRFLKMVATTFASPPSLLLYVSIQDFIVPSQLKISSITLVFEVAKLRSCQECFRFQLPILSRLMEEEIVRFFIYTQCQVFYTKTTRTCLLDYGNGTLSGLPDDYTVVCRPSSRRRQDQSSISGDRIT